MSVSFLIYECTGLDKNKNSFKMLEYFEQLVHEWVNRW